MSGMLRENEDAVIDDATPSDIAIPLDIAVAGDEAIAHYRAQVAALLTVGASVAEASAAVLDQWEAIHGPHLRATGAVEDHAIVVPLDTLRLRLAAVRRNYDYVDGHGNVHEMMNHYEQQKGDLFAGHHTAANTADPI